MLTLMNDYVLVKLEEEQKTVGGLSLPEKQNDMPSVGNLVYFDKKGIKLGSKVWFRKWSGEPIEYNKHSLLAVHKSDLIAQEGGEDL